MQNIHKVINFGYNYEVYRCETPKQLEECLMKNRNRPAFYTYYIPQQFGCWLIVAFENPEAAKARAKPKVVHGLQPLSEAESKKTITEVTACTEKSQFYDDLDSFLTLLYDKGYQVCKRVDQKEK